MKTNSLFKRLVSMLIVVLMICTLFPVTALAWYPPQLDRAHNVNVFFTVLYVDSSLQLGFSFGEIEKTTFVCQSKGWQHQHSILIADINAAATRASANKKFNTDYEIVGWTYTAGRNPEIISLTTDGTTECSAYGNIYLVATKKQPASTYKYSVTHEYYTNGVEDGSSTETISDVAYDTEVIANNITKKPTYGDNTYTYTSATPESATITDNNTEFILRYDRTVAPNFDDLKRLLEVEIDCETEGEDDEDIHPEITYSENDLIPGSFAFSKVNDYTYDVIVSSAEYIKVYSETYGPHIPEVDPKDNENNEEATVRLVYKEEDGEWKWCLADGEDDDIEFDVVCLNAPSENDLGILLLDNAVTIHCTSDSSHTDGNYPLATGTYTPGSVQGDAVNGYTCDITVYPSAYVTQYNVDKGNVEHTLDPNTQVSATIILEHNGESWQFDGTPVTFDVKCGDTSDPINWETGLSVQKVATNTTSGTVVNTVTPGEEITYTITVKNETGTALTNIKVSEVLNSNLTLKSISTENANYENGVWTISSLGNGDTATLTINVKVKDEVPDKTEIKNIATIIAATAGNDSLPDGIRPTGSSDVKVSAPEEPEEPDAPSYDELKDLLNVIIDCTNGEVSHEDKTYGLIANSDGVTSYSIGTVTEEGGVYTCDITVYAAPYVAQYSTDMNKEHSLDDDKSKTITLIYVDNYGWDVARAERATAPALAGVTFNVVCSSTTYTVRYTDGVYGVEIFKDEVYGGLLFGTRTPLFQGSLTRRGYVFTGWRPVVSGTVTGDATYIATWRKVKDTTVIEIGGGNSSSSSSKEENPNTGAPVFVGVSVGALAAAK